MTSYDPDSQFTTSALSRLEDVGIPVMTSLNNNAYFFRQTLSILFPHLSDATSLLNAWSSSGILSHFHPTWKNLVLIIHLLNLDKVAHRMETYLSEGADREELYSSDVNSGTIVHVQHQPQLPSTANIEGSDCDSDSTDNSKPQDAYSANSPLNLPPLNTKTSSSTLQSSTVAPSSLSDMTSLLASIIPHFNPSSSQQFSFLLYTHSLNFPLSTASEMVKVEEDNLESATRGMSALSKLLGTDSGGDAVTTDSNVIVTERESKGELI